MSHPILSLNQPWSNHAVFQRDQPVIVRGTAAPGVLVQGSLGSFGAQTNSDSCGSWALTFPSFSSGGPYLLKVWVAGGSGVEAEGLMAGDVWVCSGQSNMEWRFEQIPHSTNQLQAVPDIRFFAVKTPWALQPEEKVEGEWLCSTLENIPKCSAVAWHFSRRIHEETGIAIGLIVTAWGGTEAAAWMPRGSLESLPQGASFINRIDTRSFHEFQSFAQHVDEGITDEAKSWSSDSESLADWKPFGSPTHWQLKGLNFNGAVWFRYRMDIPESWIGQRLILSLGVLDDFDQTWVNGIRVGATGPENRDAYVTPRLYTVPGSFVNEGTLWVTVRIFDHWGTGGFSGPVRSMWIAPVCEPEKVIRLEDQWEYRVEKELPLRGSGNGVSPTTLFNARVFPLRHTKIRGVIWYQGESDAPRAALYRRMMPELIRAWRENWNNPSLPFHQVQLASYKARQTEPCADDWAELRDAQLLTCKTHQNSGLAVAIDVGEADDIHPRDKKSVGERLANWSLWNDYGRTDIVPSGPLYARYEIEGKAVRLHFRFGQGLHFCDEKNPPGFSLAGEDQQFRWAQARIEGETVVVSSPHIMAPQAVRYAWHSNPLGATLRNAAGLPASPFRTDDWPLSTEGVV